jgi:hypothetical protein
MKFILDNIAAQLGTAAIISSRGDIGAYIDLLDRVMGEARRLKKNALHTEFGKLFTPAGSPVTDPDAPQMFVIDQKVHTKDGYIGTVVGHDKHGKAIVNIVWQACEYPEAQLVAIPDKAVLETMKQQSPKYLTKVTQQGLKNDYSK